MREPHLNIAMDVAASVLSPSALWLANFLVSASMMSAARRLRARALMLPCACLNHARTQTQMQATGIPWGPLDVPSYVSCHWISGYIITIPFV